MPLRSFTTSEFIMTKSSQSNQKENQQDRKTAGNHGSASERNATSSEKSQGSRQGQGQDKSQQKEHNGKSSS